MWFKNLLMQYFVLPIYIRLLQFRVEIYNREFDEHVEIRIKNNNTKVILHDIFGKHDYGYHWMIENNIRRLQHFMRELHLETMMDIGPGNVEVYFGTGLDPDVDREKINNSLNGMVEQLGSQNGGVVKDIDE